MHYKRNESFLRPTNIDEADKKSSISSYWSLHHINRTPGLKEVMSRNRFQLLSSFLHFCDNEQRISQGQEGYDPLFKIKPLIDVLKPFSIEVLLSST